MLTKLGAVRRETKNCVRGIFLDDPQQNTFIQYTHPVTEDSSFEPLPGYQPDPGCPLD